MRSSVCALVLVALVALVMSSTASAAGFAWRGPQVIASPGVANEDVAIDDAGDAVVIYTENDTVDGATLEASYRPVGGVFGPAQVLATNAFNAQVAMAGDGTAFVTWSSGRITFTTNVAVAPLGGTFGPAQALGTNTSAYSSVVADAQGDAAVLWGDKTGIVAARRRPGAGFEAPVALGAGTYIHSSAGMDAAGNLLVVWEYIPPSPSDFEIQSADLRRGADAWSSVDTLFTGNGELPRLAVGPDGTAIATILGASPERSFVRAPGGAWGPVTTPVPGSGSGHYEVAADGRIHVYWVDSASGKLERRVRETDGTLSAPEPVSTPDGASPQYLALKVLGDGSENVVWSGAGATPHVYATQHQSDGASVTTALPDAAGGVPGHLTSALSADGHGVLIGHPPNDSSSLVAWVADTAWPPEPSRVPRGSAPPPTSGTTAPPPDHTAPKLTSSTRHRVGSSITAIRLRLAVDEAALVQVTGVVDPRGAAPRRRLSTVLLGVTPGSPVVTSVTLPRAIRAALKRAHGGVVRLRVVAYDAAKNQSPVTTVKVTISG